MGAEQAVWVVEQFAKNAGFIGLIMGLLYVSLAAAVVMLWRERRAVERRTTKERETLMGLLMTLQNSRVEDAKSVRDELKEQAKDFNAALEEVAGTVEALKDAVLYRSKSDSGKGG